ncbi:ankyrin-1-like [Leptopilina heterotoma]|uniref:ankyrin-1-like n=1 Tax=Leptopilina heterotoma TaxID=63436 RepID=UPI001CA91284|nr:ankyrin-1-like [Leptopilina heterotoma]
MYRREWYYCDFGYVSENEKNSDESRQCIEQKNVARGHLHIVDLLIEKGATINVKDSGGGTPLFIALHENKIEVAEFLLENGTCLDIPSKDSIKILNVAVARQKAGCSVDSCFRDNITPLHTAATFEHTRLVEILLKHGARINSETRDECIVPLDFAAAAKHFKMIKFLLASEMLLIAGDLKEEDMLIVNVLLDKVINLRISDENDQTSISDNKEIINIVREKMGILYCNCHMHSELFEERISCMCSRFAVSAT